jgi:curved DNA-binding protein CbpA
VQTRHVLDAGCATRDPERAGIRLTSRDAYEVLQVRPDASMVVVQAAFRALASLYHPDADASAGSTRRMAELNDAYAQLRTAERRALYDRTRQQAQLSQPAASASHYVHVATPRTRAAAQRGVLDFGRYDGMTIAELARRDPDYLLWLRRHSSGIRYRTEIDGVLAPTAPPSDPPRRKVGR